MEEEEEAQEEVRRVARPRPAARPPGGRAALLGARLPHHRHHGPLSRHGASASRKGCRPVSATYAMVREIGRGTFGRLSLAFTREGPSQAVALKFLATKGLADAELLWQREIQTLRALDHPNVVSLLGSYPPTMMGGRDHEAVWPSRPPTWI